MSKEGKKQFSLSLAVRVFLFVLVVVSIGIFANSVMYYNQLDREVRRLEEALEELYEVRDELSVLLGSAEELNALLADYRECQELLEAGGLTGEALAEYNEKMAQVRALLEESRNRDYITSVAKDQLGLFFADEEIFYNDMH